MNSKPINFIGYLTIIILLEILIGCSNNKSNQNRFAENKTQENQNNSINRGKENSCAFIIESRFLDLKIDSLIKVINALIHENEYFEYDSKYYSTKRDTAEITDSYKGTIFEYSFSVYASRNKEYFSIHYDTTCLGPIGIPTGCDSPTKTHLLFCQGDKLLWKEIRANNIGSVYFFEDNGSSLVSWDDVWAENFHLLYNKEGAIIDTIPSRKRVYGLDNNRVILLEHIRAKYNKVNCIDNTGKTIWSDELFFKDGNQRRFHIANDGSRFMFEYIDSMVLYNSNGKFLWKGNNPDFNTYGHFYQGGDYFLKSTTASLMGNKRILIYDKDHPEVISNFKTIEIQD